MNFESFINDFVIPENWKILSARFPVELFTREDQRLKIIGEIIEFHEALTVYKELVPENYDDVIAELADIVISTCTMLRILERGYRWYNESFSVSPEAWICLVLGRNFDRLISTAKEYSELHGIDLEEAIRKKIEYNRTRPDWT